VMNEQMKSDLLNKIVREVHSFYCAFPFGKMPIWSLVHRGFLFEAFRRGGKEGVSEVELAHKVNEVSRLRRGLMLLEPPVFPPSGKILAFYPDMTMYDGISEQASDAFFDSDDVPPPELWLFFGENTLFSFIPDEFVGRANSGVENSMSGCLEWV
jgi:hypothetical protein